MLTTFFSMIFKYFNVWLLMGVSLAAAVISEKLYLLLCAALAHRRPDETGVPSIRNLRAVLKLEIALPETASINLALYAPALALAALAAVCASLPFCTFMPIIDNNADMLQLLQLFLLGELFVALAIYALGTEEAGKIVNRNMRQAFALLFPMVALCASASSLLVKNGLDTDPFSLNSITVAGQFSSLSKFGIAGFVIFLYLILSRIPHRKLSTGCALLTADELPQYGGAPRAAIQLWSVYRSFIIISMITSMLFPKDMGGALNGAAAFSWRSQSLSFLVFWLAVAAMRIFVVPFCWVCSDLIRKYLPKKLGPWLFFALAALAMLLLWYEGILLQQEAASF